MRRSKDLKRHGMTPFEAPLKGRVGNGLPMARRSPRTVLAGLVLAAGASLYLFRADDTRLVPLLRVGGLPALADGLHALRCTLHASVQLPAPVLGSGADLAFGLALGMVLVDAGAAIQVAGAILVAAVELLQLPPFRALLPGTFDPVDLVVSSLGYALGLSLFAYEFQTAIPSLSKTELS